MAKSLRSKFKRKMRSLARTKKAHKEDALLDGAVARREAYELAQKEKEPAPMVVPEDETTVEKTSTLNTKTMKKADGKFPIWLSQRKQKNASRAVRQSKKAKAKKSNKKR